ncbi:ead/Ea22-like family protein [Klebsiella pneumoniae]|uniref:ead/Ea22-like family protein n=2 Tax=Klebsiella pneumoniae TaxID=573 RepID=UPI0027E24E82|nr:ead/Ea22-like family protein [Klebsiella pneumoniae]
MTDITELARSLKAAADREMICRDGAETSEIWERTVTPENILALVEALEKAQAAERRWHRVASRIHEQACESDVKIDELEAIRAAAEKLVRCKGRYHSEQNYRALAALFGVKTPDLPPLEHENVHYADAAEMEIAALRQRIAELESRTATVAAADVLAERKRQVSAEGWTPGHDDEYEHGELADAAGCYALSSELFDCAGEPPRPWPWPDEWWKPTNRRRDLVKAGALILAEIERLDRAAGIRVEAE